jgi:hypothetical protein
MQNTEFRCKRQLKENYYYNSITTEHFPSDAAIMYYKNRKCRL